MSGKQLGSSTMGKIFQGFFFFPQNLGQAELNSFPAGRVWELGVTHPTGGGEEQLHPCTSRDTPTS